MDGYRNNNEEWSGCDDIADVWEPYRGKYPEPTHRESNLIHHFLINFPLEDDNFVEEENQPWNFFKRHLGSPPNLRSRLIRFLTQVRATKGYGVDTYFDFSVVPDWRRFHVFIPRNLNDQKFNRQAIVASFFALRTINASTGKNYKVVSAEKLVSTTTDILLLTFTAKEIIDATAHLENLQAMLYAPTRYGATTYELLEWKFKPIPYEQL